MRYSEELIKAVKYLYEKGFKSTEIAKRLDTSPFTVRNVISILNKKPKMKEFVWINQAKTIKIILRVPENIYRALERLDEDGYLSNYFQIKSVARFIKLTGLGEYEYHEIEQQAKATEHKKQV